MPAPAERPFRTRGWGRLGALARVAPLPPAAFAVHQLRYLLAYGGAAGAELQRTGHSYLHSVVPWLVALLAVSAGGFLRAFGRALSGHTSARRYSASLAVMWVACSACLIAVFTCQELLEGWFATGHPGGLAGVFGYGGWWAVPVAMCVGLVLAAWFHGARWVLQTVAERRARPRPPAAAPVLRLLRSPRFGLLWAREPLIDGSCGRGPPV